jgi:intracellular sulfur oxidation DsrE/DsrF family protein
MKQLSRRSFVSHAAAGVALMAAPAGAERVYNTTDWKMAAFQQLLDQPAQAKQLFDMPSIEEGSGFDHMVNSLEGLQFGFGIPVDQIKIVAAIRAKATVLNFNDYIWEKYNVGEMAKVNDPETGKPATRNIFYLSKMGNPPHYSSQDPNDEGSLFRDSSIQGLQARGVQLLACHMAINSLAGGMTKRAKADQSREDTVKDIQAHLLPGVIVVPSMVSAIAMLQTRGRFSYLRM